MKNIKTKFKVGFYILAIFGLLVVPLISPKEVLAEYAVPSCTSATLNGTVIPNGAPTEAWFEWGLGTSLTNSTPSQTFTQTSNDSYLITGLTENTLYSFRAVAQNRYGTTIGQTLSFRTNTCTQPLPTVNLTANPSNIQSGQSSTLSWTSQNATSCNISQIGNVSTSGSRNVTPQNTTTYTITCRNNSGVSATDSATVTVVIPPPQNPTVNLTANPDTIQRGQSSTLSWNSQNATSCNLSQFGNVPTSGSRNVSPTNTTTYTITCTNGSGQNASDSATVTVTQQPPAANLNANPTSVQSGGTTYLSLSTINVTSCTANAYPFNSQWNGSKPLSGNFTITNLTTTTTFNINCTGQGGQATDSVLVTVIVPPPQNPTVNLTANPASIERGQSSTLSWNSQNATSCNISQFGSVSLSGSRQVTPANTTTYDITCRNSSGQIATDSATVMVAQPQPLTVSLTADNSNLPYNGNTILRWNSQNATSCSASGGTNGWAGGKNLSGTFFTGNLTNTQAYNITCTKSGATPANASVVVVVGGPVVNDPTVTLTADDTDLDYNQSTNVRWTSQYATSCTADGGSNGWANPRALSGIFYTGRLASTTTYNITCRNTAGVSVSASVRVNVGGQSTPTVTLVADNTNVAYNGATNIRWNSTNATSCTANGGSNGWANPKALSGIFYTGNLTNTTTYNITCVNLTGGSASASETVNVGTLNVPDPIVDIFADDANVIHGGSTNIRWNSENATSCTGNGGANGWANSKPLSGIFYTGNLTNTTTYNITCRNSIGRIASASVKVNVDGQPNSNPAVSIFADNTDLTGGESTNIRWNSTNAVSCSGNAGSNGWAGTKGLAGIFNTGRLYANITYNITCNGSTGAAATGSVTILVQNQAPTVTLTADDVTLDFNGNTSIRWASTNATSCVASIGTNGWAGNRQLNGSFYSGNLRNTTTYNITCKNIAGQEAFDSVTVSVAGQPPAPTCQDPNATNYGGPLPCRYPPPPPQTCQDPNATNYGGPLPCRYPPPPPQTCQDPNATNYGGSLPCRYPPPDPTVTLTADESNVSFNGSTTIRWTTTNTTTCTASSGSNGWAGNKNRFGGNFPTGPLTSTKTYNITCNGVSGTTPAFDSVTVSVGQAQDPTVILTADEETVPYGGNTVIRWSTTNTTTCNATSGSSGWVGAKNRFGGNFPTGPLTSTKTYNITCNGVSGTTPAFDSVTVSVGQAQDPTVTISANPISVANNGSSVITWSSQNTVSCNATAGTNGWAGSKSTTGSFPTGTLINNGTSSIHINYNINCVNIAGRSVNASATVTVRPKIIVITLQPNPGIR